MKSAWQNCELMYIKDRVTFRWELQNLSGEKFKNKFWMALDKTKKCAKLRTHCSARFWVGWVWNTADENPVFLEKLNSANGPDRDWTEKQTPSMFDQENLNLWWIQESTSFEVRKKAQTNSSLLQNIFCTESLILAQNERWRHGLGMQVERCSNAQWRKGEERVSNLPSSWE